MKGPHFAEGIRGFERAKGENYGGDRSIYDVVAYIVSQMSLVIFFRFYIMWEKYNITKYGTGKSDQWPKRSPGSW